MNKHTLPENRHTNSHLRTRQRIASGAPLPAEPEFRRAAARNRIAGVSIARSGATRPFVQTTSPGWASRSSQLRSPPSREPATRRFAQARRRGKHSAACRDAPICATASPGWASRSSTRAKPPCRSPGALICIIRIARVSTVQFAARTAERCSSEAIRANRVAGVGIAQFDTRAPFRAASRGH